MTIPRIDLPTLYYVHLSVLRGMASDHTLSQKVGTARVDKREGIFEDIELRVFEVRRRMDLRNVENDEIEGLVKTPRHQSPPSQEQLLYMRGKPQARTLSA